MPKENKKRGRREDQKKRKRDQQSEQHFDAKRLKNDQADDIPLEDESYHHGAFEGVSRPEDMPFYGMLDEEEQAYFKQADDTLELNQFSDAEERSIFLASVWKEADGKELKIANSQSCSRLMERLILLSDQEQLKALFQKFSGK